ncbi:putative metalloprotease CJM1_0395 family protein [Salidesulfovibrio onnuriiensis]|uniref:putative metalloprotease CJM1_0395 family protein n=1 Tax=Salidesulfovibrio onnuriiensis TaxID=2583823 RepID=UPI0011C6ED07|nr:putative metalloprotease CJM1_0395 family protein [Salidesulfovibrio onnuriiensis]
MINSINSFTASLAGSLFDSLQQLHCGQKIIPVSKSSEQPDQHQKKEEQTSGRGTAASQLKTNKSEKASKSTETESELKEFKDLTLKQQQEVTELQQRDQEVRAHEQAHIAAAAGNVRGGATFSYQTGPDGRQYAVGGSVSIDTTPVAGDAEATEEKAKTVRRAALAPANPSAQDQKVASQAAAMEMQARMEQMTQKQEEQEKDSSFPEEPQDALQATPAQERKTHTAITAYRDAQSPVSEHPIFSSFM